MYLPFLILVLLLLKNLSQTKMWVCMCHLFSISCLYSLFHCSLLFSDDLNVIVNNAAADSDDDVDPFLIDSEEAAALARFNDSFNSGADVVGYSCDSNYVRDVATTVGSGEDGDSVLASVIGLTCPLQTYIQLATSVLTIFSVTIPASSHHCRMSMLPLFVLWSQSIVISWLLWRVITSTVPRISIPLVHF